MTKRNILKTLILIGLVSLLMSGCFQGEKEEQREKIKVASLSGPTGMGMVKIMEDTTKYQVDIYQSPDEVVSKIITGEIEIAAVPSNLAAVLYNKLEGNIKILATNTQGILYILENGDAINEINDLRGKTILASGKGSSPEFILNKILIDVGIDPIKDVNITWMANHSDVSSALVSNKDAIAMLPQPFVTVVTEKIENIRISIDMDKQWFLNTGSHLPMGVIIGQKTLIEDRPNDVEQFLADYEKSVDFVNEEVEDAAKLISKYGIISDPNIAKMAIPFCNIVFINAQDSKENLMEFYSIIGEMDPKSVGGSQPDENIFYKYE